jgi:HEAT repeat protein
MKRILLGLVAAAALALLVAPEAKAHGGQFRGPGGGVPPGLREPSDPTPPPPPPPTTPPPTTPPDPTPGNPPGPTTPPTKEAPPVTAPPKTEPDENKGGGRKAPTSFDQWVFWWNNNNDDILQLKEAIYRLRSTKEGGFGALGQGSGRNDATRATEKQVKETLIPALLWAMDRANKQHPDTESASYIALAKVTDDPSHIPLLMSGVAKDGKKNGEVDQIVNESAALSLGLLRRADKSRQFDAKELDRVRDFLFQVFEDGQYQTRTRGFAMLSIGLLGDQPTTRTRQATTGGGGLFHAPDPAATGEVAADRIYGLLQKSYSDEQMPIVALLALSMQPPGDVTREMAGTLKDVALKAKLYKESVSDLVASYGALALGRVGTAEDIRPLVDALKLKQTGANVKRSAAIALGQLGKRVDGPARAQLALELFRALESVKEASAKNFGIISLAYLLEADIRAERTDVLNAKVKVADELMKIADEGKYSERPYGALALGLIGREIGDHPSILEYGQLRMKSIEILRKGLQDQKIDKRARAAFAVGLGLLRDDGRVKDLASIVADKAEDSELRGYAAVALGMIGTTNADVVKAIKDAMSERSSEELRQQTAIALGLLGTSDSVTLLLKELEEADTMNVQGQIVLALARIGDARTIEPLVKLLKDSSKPDLTRALACAGLGLIGDLELIPSLARISKDINFRAAPDVINEVLSIL